MTPRVQGKFLRPKCYEAGVRTSHQADEEQTRHWHSLAVFYCLHTLRDRTVTTLTPLRIHKELDDILPMNVKGKWNQLAPNKDLFSGKGTNT